MATTVIGITEEALGMRPTDNLIQQTIPPIAIMDVASFRSGDPNNKPNFTSTAGTVCRLGLFACSDGNLERVVFLVLPRSASPSRLLIGITHGFAQNGALMNTMNWQNPRSPALIQSSLLKHVINRWGAQMLAAGNDTALFQILRAGNGHELGPFAGDGAFTREAVDEVRRLTNNAFSVDTVDLFSFSSGIYDLNNFIPKISGRFNIATIYNIDPSHASAAAAPRGAIRKQFLSGQTGGARAGFEFMPRPRWENEWMFHSIPHNFTYLHNWVMPMYCLNLGLRTRGAAPGA